MARHYYETAIDSPTGKRLSKFWQQCIKCEEAAEDYAKKMGARTYYSDPRYFAGGVVCIAFAPDQRIDKGVWRIAGVDHEDQETYYQPDCEQRMGFVEVPSRDYRLRDTFDRIYDRSRIQEREGKLFVPYVEFFRAEPSGHSGSSPSGERTASRGLRKAIKAEVRRQRLPVMRTESLLAILGAAEPVKPVAVAQQHTEQPATPTFFAYRSRYFIGIDYSCDGNTDLQPITPQQYNHNCSRMQAEAKRGGC